MGEISKQLKTLFVSKGWRPKVKPDAAWTKVALVATCTIMAVLVWLWNWVVETDFVAKNEDFRKLVDDICQHIAATDPLCIDREEVDPALIEKEKEIYAEQVKGKTRKMWLKKILEGKNQRVFQRKMFAWPTLHWRCQDECERVHQHI